MSKREKQPSENPKYFEYEPADVSDEETFADMADLGTAPEEIPDPKVRAAFVKFLETYEAEE